MKTNMATFEIPESPQCVLLSLSTENSQKRTRQVVSNFYLHTCVIMYTYGILCLRVFSFCPINFDFNCTVIIPAHHIEFQYELFLCLLVIFKVQLAHYSMYFTSCCMPQLQALGLFQRDWHQSPGLVRIQSLHP